MAKATRAKASRAKASRAKTSRATTSRAKTSRAVWSGSISFGLVNVPVRAYAAVHDHTVHFHQLEKGSGARIRYRKVSDESGDEVDAADIELGYELSKGRYVTKATISTTNGPGILLDQNKTRALTAEDED